MRKVFLGAVFDGVHDGVGRLFSLDDARTLESIECQETLSFRGEIECAKLAPF